MALGLIALFWPLIQDWLDAAARAGRVDLIRCESRELGGHCTIARIVEYCIPVMSDNRTHASRRAGASDPARETAATPRLAIEPIDTSFSFKNKAYAALEERHRVDGRLSQPRRTSGSTSASSRRISASAARRCARRWRSSSARASCARCRAAASMWCARPRREVIEMITAWAALESMAARLITEQRQRRRDRVAAQHVRDLRGRRSCARSSTNIPRSTSSSTRPSSA